MSLFVIEPPENTLVQIFMKIQQVDQKLTQLKHFNVIIRYRTPRKHTGANFHKDWTGKSKVTRRGLTTNIFTS